MTIIILITCLMFKGNKKYFIPVKKVNLRIFLQQASQKSAKDYSTDDPWAPFVLVYCINLFLFVCTSYITWQRDERPVGATSLVPPAASEISSTSSTERGIGWRYKRHREAPKEAAGSAERIKYKKSGGYIKILSITDLLLPNIPTQFHFPTSLGTHMHDQYNKPLIYVLQVFWTNCV